MSQFHRDPTEDPQFAKLLKEAREGSRDAADRLWALIHGELRRMASSRLRSERKDHTSQTTALADDAFMKLLGGNSDIRDRRHFYAVAAEAMRDVLVDSARRRLAAKRGGGALKVELVEGLAVTEDGLHSALLVSEALEKLEKIDPRQARVVVLRFYVGMSHDDIAEELGISKRQVIRDWKSAQAWLYAEFSS